MFQCNIIEKNMATHLVKLIKNIVICTFTTNFLRVAFVDLPLEIVEEITLLDSFKDIYNRSPINKQWGSIYRKKTFWTNYFKKMSHREYEKVIICIWNNELHIVPFLRILLTQSRDFGQIVDLRILCLMAHKCGDKDTIKQLYRICNDHDQLYATSILLILDFNIKNHYYNFPPYDSQVLEKIYETIETHIPLKMSHC